MKGKGGKIGTRTGWDGERDERKESRKTRDAGRLNKGPLAAAAPVLMAGESMFDEPYYVAKTVFNSRATHNKMSNPRGGGGAEGVRAGKLREESGLEQLQRRSGAAADASATRVQVLRQTRFVLVGGSGLLGSRGRERPTSALGAQQNSLSLS